MKKISIIFSFLCALLFVSCQEQEDVTSEVNPNLELGFQVLANDDQTPLINEDGAMNELSYGSTLYFTDQTKGGPKQVQWVLSKSGFSKTITAKNGKASYRVMIAGDYDLKFIADGQSLSYPSYLSVIGAGEPVPEPVSLRYSLLLPDQTLVDSIDAGAPATDAKHVVVQGESIVLNDLSGGNPSTVSWTIENADGSVSKTLEVQDIPWGQHAPAQTFTFDVPAGLYSITMTSGKDKFESQQVIEVYENLLTTAGYDYSFEKAESVGAFKNLWWFGSPTSTIAFTPMKAHTGTQSVHFNVDFDGDKSIAAAYKYTDETGAAQNCLVSVEADATYELAFWMYVESKGSGNSQIDFNLNHNPLYGGVSAIYVTPETELGVWKKYTVKLPAKSTTKDFMLIRLIHSQPGQDADLSVYFDDLTMRKLP